MKKIILAAGVELLAFPAFAQSAVDDANTQRLLSKGHAERVYRDRQLRSGVKL